MLLLPLREQSFGSGSALSTSMTEPFRVRLMATIHKVQTMQDGGGRITIDFAESEFAEAVKLFARASEAGLLLTVTFEEETVDPRYFG